MKAKKSVLLWVLVALMLMTASGCANNPVSQTTMATMPSVTIPADKENLDGKVHWLRSTRAFDESIGYSGGWSIQIENETQWSEVLSEYGLSSSEKPNFDQYVILILFYSDHIGSEYELTQLALKDGMATIGIHEKTVGATEGLELVGCVVSLDEAPLEINSYRDEEAVG